jgi:hypothetical protein
MRITAAVVKKNGMARTSWRDSLRIGGVSWAVGHCDQSDCCGIH